MKKLIVSLMVLLLLSSCASLFNMNLSDNYKKGNIHIVTYAKMVEGKTLIYGQTYQFGPGWDMNSVCIDLANVFYEHGYSNGYLLVEMKYPGQMGGDYTPSQYAVYQASFYKD